MVCSAARRKSSLERKRHTFALERTKLGKINLGIHLGNPSRDKSCWGARGGFSRQVEGLAAFGIPFHFAGGNAPFGDHFRRYIPKNRGRHL
jgi:hypothetical protein